MIHISGLAVNGRDLNYSKNVTQNIIWENHSLQLFTYTVKPPILRFWVIHLQMALNLGHTVHMGIWLGPYHKVHNIIEKAKSGNVKSNFRE
jgi:hypothetical protein